MNEKLGYIIFWFLFVFGLLSFAITFSVDYGIVYTMMITLICGMFDLLLARGLGEKGLMVLSVLLIASPYIMFLVIYLI